MKHSSYTFYHYVICFGLAEVATTPRALHPGGACTSPPESPPESPPACCMQGGGRSSSAWEDLGGAAAPPEIKNMMALNCYKN